MGRRFGGNGLIGRFFLLLEKRMVGVQTRLTRGIQALKCRVSKEYGSYLALR